MSSRKNSRFASVDAVEFDLKVTSIRKKYYLFTGGRTKTFLRMMRRMRAFLRTCRMKRRKAIDI